MGVNQLRSRCIFSLTITVLVILMGFALLSTTHSAESGSFMRPESTQLDFLRDVIIPIANMGIGAIIAILLIWTIYPVLTRNTEMLREIAATLDVMTQNNLLISKKLLEIIERQALIQRGRD